MRVTSDDDIVVVDVTVAQGPPGPPGPQGPPGEGGGDGIPQGGPLTEDLLTGGFALRTADAPAGETAELVTIAAGGGNGGFALGALVSAEGGTAGGSGGSISFRGGEAMGGSGGDGGDVLFEAGAGDGAGRAGLIRISNLPTADPAVAGALWNDGGTLKVSAG